jgi:hypothetical protein
MLNQSIKLARSHAMQRQKSKPGAKAIMICKLPFHPVPSVLPLLRRLPGPCNLPVRILRPPHLDGDLDTQLSMPHHQACKHDYECKTRVRHQEGKGVAYVALPRLAPHNPCHNAEQLKRNTMKDARSRGLCSHGGHGRVVLQCRRRCSPRVDRLQRREAAVIVSRNNTRLRICRQPRRRKPRQ